MAGTMNSLRAFQQASLAFFAMGTPPAVVASKFESMVSKSTVYRWYHEWCDLKGIPVESRTAKKTKNRKVRKEYDCDRIRREVSRHKRSKSQQMREAKEKLEALRKAGFSDVELDYTGS